MFTITSFWRSRALAVAVVGMVAWSMAIAAGAEHSARTLVRETTSRLVEVLKSERESLREDPQLLHEIVDEYVLPYFDFERMSRRVLGKHWKKAAPEQRSQFVMAFRSLLVRTYTKALSEYRDQTITYLDPVARKKDDEVIIPVQVEQGGSSPIRIAYAVYQDGEDWKVFDVSINGVSLVKNYRSSFRSEIARHGLDALIARIEAKSTGAPSQ